MMNEFSFQLLPSFYLAEIFTYLSPQDRARFSLVEKTVSQIDSKTIFAHLEGLGYTFSKMDEKRLKKLFLQKCIFHLPHALEQFRSLTINLADQAASIHFGIFLDLEPQKSRVHQKSLQILIETPLMQTNGHFDWNNPHHFLLINAHLRDHSPRSPNQERGFFLNHYKKNLSIMGTIGEFVKLPELSQQELKFENLGIRFFAKKSQ